MQLDRPHGRPDEKVAWGSDVAEKIAILGALSLYLDFVNLFQFLMSFLGQERE